MKNILIISSSFRKGGNSDLLCDEFQKGAESAGHKVEKIRLAEKKINFCLGCGVCNSTHKCVQKDDMAELMEKMLTADVIVLATPVYFYAMSGLLKTFIDRTVPRYTDISNKEFYYIMTAADTSSSTVKYALGEFKGLMDCLSNPVERGYLFAGGVWKKGEINNTQYLQKAFDAGKNI